MLYFLKWEVVNALRISLYKDVRVLFSIFGLIAIKVIPRTSNIIIQIKIMIFLPPLKR